jgi:Ni/Co efflux regulator RcnB
MNRLLLSVAALALMTAPVFAQHEEGHGDRHGQPHTDAPHAAPARPAGDAGRGMRHGQPQAAAPQAARPAPQFAPRAAPQNNGRDFNRQGDHRQDNHFGNRPADHGFDNRGGVRPGFRPGGNTGFGGHRDYHSFNGYHRSFNAPQRFRGPSYRRPSGWYSHRWSFGEILPSLFWSSGYWLNDYQAYDLPPPPYGTVWVRNGDDALLIDRDSGEIISVEYGVFY